MDLRKKLLTKNRCYKIGKITKKKGVMWHSTGANNPNLKRYIPDDGSLGKNANGNHWDTYQPGGRNVCVHAFIGKLKNGKIATYQTLPWDMRGWHCGGTGNNDYIGFEICEDNLKNKTYFNNVYKEAVELTAYLCKKYGWDPMAKNVIICHADGAKLGIASNHGDVLHWFKKHGKTMADVRKDVAKAMGLTEEKEKPKKEVKVFEPYKVKITTKTLNVRAGAGTKHKVTTTVKKNEVYTIVEEKKNGSTKWGKLKSGAGWISLNYAKRV